MKSKEEREDKEVFIKELVEAKMDNAVDKYKFSKHWHFQKKEKEVEPLIR